jgi:acyl-CoA synthetase (AMP-forming)/AMP-acid ligase II
MGADQPAQSMLVPDPAFERFPHSALDGSIIDRFKAVAARYPDRPAVWDRDLAVTYTDLAALVHRVSSHIAQTLGDREGPVAILMPDEARPAQPARAPGVGRAVQRLTKIRITMMIASTMRPQT